MAGHRHATGRPKRQGTGALARRRLASAQTAEDQLAAAYALFRVSARGDAPRMRRAAEFLTALSNGGGDGHRE